MWDWLYIVLYSSSVSKSTVGVPYTWGTFFTSIYCVSCMYFIELWNKHHCQIWDKMWAETDQKEDVKLKTHFLWLRPFSTLAAGLLTVMGWINKNSDYNQFLVTEINVAPFFTSQISVAHSDTNMSSYIQSKTERMKFVWDPSLCQLHRLRRSGNTSLFYWILGLMFTALPKKKGEGTGGASRRLEVSNFLPSEL